MLLLFLLSWVTQSQELPPVLNFSPNDYQAGNQNWMVSRADNGKVYVANSMGLLEFNGSRWDLYPVPNSTIVRAVKAVGGKIFTGAYMEAGYWVNNSSGLLEYRSLLSKFPDEIQDGEQFWRIEALGKTVVFQSFEGLYLYHLERDTIQQVETPPGGPISNLFKVGTEIYFLIPGQGIFNINNGVAILQISAEVLGGKEVVQIFGKDNDLQLVTRTGEIFSYNGESLARINFLLSERISGKSVFSALQLEDKSLLLGTVENGLYHVNEAGELLEHFNQENGLQNNTVLSLFLDENANVWAGLDNGLSILNLKSPFRIFQDHVGRIGTVYSSFQNENFLYLGTNQGLYYRRTGEENFSFISGTNGQVWSLQLIDDVLFCGHNNGTFVISEDKAQKISDRLGTWLVIDYEPKEGIYVQGHYNGFSFLERTGDNFRNLPMVKDFPHSSKYIVSEENGDIWISNEHKGVFRLNLNDSLTEIQQLKNYSFNEGSGITSGIFKFDEQLYYSDIDEIFQYDKTTDSFVGDNALSAALGEVKRISGRMIAIEDKVLAFGEHSIVSAGLSKLEDGFTIKSYYLPQEYRSIPLGYENLTRLQENEYMLGLVDGYLLFDDTRKNVNDDYIIRIEKITRAALDEEPVAVPLGDTQKFNYSTNNLNFYFSIPEYKKFIIPFYSYRLKGLSEKWSEWGPQAYAGFENLRFGTYEFEVRGKVGDQILPAASFQFIIARPWYLSNLAIAAYILMFLLLLYIIHLVNRKEHDKKIRENEKVLKMQNLEAEQKIIRLQNEQLEKEMEGKSRELAVSTMSLIKKNEFLSSIREKLKNSESSTQVNSVIKTIDKDISEKDNWNFFEKAFNNADKEFFKKIKSRHPDLTSNDLKLCAYLRLNLTSKEIAPLLNISVKSVEIKRYRLRKKMDLPHETNLVDYILEV